jgi:hypothetical protein
VYWHGSVVLGLDLRLLEDLGGGPRRCGRSGMVSCVPGSPDGLGGNACTTALAELGGLAPVAAHFAP